MNQLEVFTKVRDHLLKQNEASLSNERADGVNFVCMYRGQNGMKCAIGCLIPDDQYVKGMERRDIGYLLSNYPKFLSIFDGTLNDWEPYRRAQKPDQVTQLIPFLDGLQRIHDDHEPSQWARLLSNFQSDWGLI